MGEGDNLLSGQSLLWVIIIGVVVALIVILVISRRDDKEPKDVQQQNDRNLLPWLVGVGAVVVVVGVAWYYGLFDSMGSKAAAATGVSISSTRGKTPQQVNQERLAQSASRSPSRSPAARSSRSPARGSLSSRNE